MGDGFRAVKIAAIVMGVLIVLGTTVLIVMVVKRGTSAGGAAFVPDRLFSTVLEEPPGTSIQSVTPVRDRLAVQLRGGGPDRILIVDPGTGAVTGRIATNR